MIGVDNVLFLYGFNVKSNLIVQLNFCYVPCLVFDIHIFA